MCGLLTFIPQFNRIKTVFMEYSAVIIREQNNLNLLLLHKINLNEIIDLGQ